MFSILNGSGGRSEYVPGAFRSRRVKPVFPTGPVREGAIHPDDGDREEVDAVGVGRRSRAAVYQPREREPEEALLARQIMSRPVISLEATTPLRQAWDLILERRFRHLPVRTETGRMTGILSDRDALYWWARSTNGDIPIREIMATPVLVAHPDTEIRRVARVLFEEHIGAMPIVDDDGEPVGILTRSDILRAVIQRAPLHLWI